MKTAILGWGSLLWEGGAEFDKWHEQWQCDGPSLKLEFSRVSCSRSGALTLVIDPKNGTLTTVAYTLSIRSDPKDAICDLRSREGTSLKNIGYVFLSKNQNNYNDKESYDGIVDWAKRKQIDVVVWTDLYSNFSDKEGCAFSVKSAISYLKTLDEASKVKAAEYIRRAPNFVQTKLRKALQGEPWF